MNSFWLVHDIRGWYHIGIALFEETAEQLHLATEDETALLVRGKALGYAGYYTGVVGNPERGLALAKEAIALLRPLNQSEALLYSLYCATLNYNYLHNADQVMGLAQEWHQIAKEIGDRWAETVSLNFMAIALMSQHKLTEAQRTIDQALQIFGQEIGEYFGLTWAALIRGRIALAQGAYAEAKSFYERSLQAAQAINYRRTTQQTYDNLGDVAFYLGELDQAEHYFRLSLEITEETGQTREMLATLYDLARVWAAQGKKAEAVELLAVVLHHPLSDLPLLLRTEATSLREAAERLRIKLETDLEPQIYQSAWARGYTMAIEQAIENVLEDSDNKLQMQRMIPPDPLADD